MKSIFNKRINKDIDEDDDALRRAASLLVTKITADLNSELIEDYETAIDIYEIFEDDAVARQIAIDSLKEAIRLIKEAN